MKLKKELAKQEPASKGQLQKHLKNLVVLNEARIDAVHSAGHSGCGMCG